MVWKWLRHLSAGLAGRECGVKLSSVQPEGQRSCGNLGALKEGWCSKGLVHRGSSLPRPYKMSHGLLERSLSFPKVFVPVVPPKLCMGQGQGRETWPSGTEAEAPCCRDVLNPPVSLLITEP